MTRYNDNSPRPLALSLQEVAKLLGLSASTIRRWTRQGNPYAIPHIRAGRRILYTIDDVEAWIRRLESIAQRPTEKQTPSHTKGVQNEKKQ